MDAPEKNIFKRHLSTPLVHFWGIFFGAFRYNVNVAIQGVLAGVTHSVILAPQTVLGGPFNVENHDHAAGDCGARS
jgi:hypothetical protein